MHTNVPLTLKDKTVKSAPCLSMRRKHLMALGEEDKHRNCAHDPNIGLLS